MDGVDPKLGFSESKSITRHIEARYGVPSYQPTRSHPSAREPSSHLPHVYTWMPSKSQRYEREYVHSLYKCITLAAPGHWITVEIDKLKFTKWFEDLFDIGLAEVEVERPNVEPKEEAHEI